MSIKMNNYAPKLITDQTLKNILLTFEIFKQIVVVVVERSKIGFHLKNLFKKC